MASKVKIDNGRIRDGGRQVALLKNGTIYQGSSASSSKLLAMTKADKIYSTSYVSSSKCIGLVKSGTIYNKATASSSYKVGTTKDAEKVILGRCSEVELGAIYILMKSGKI
tara:strand:- start:2829 stop:3161 length:333 start_codon:yes stop_codon:yes gene_type:complete